MRGFLDKIKDILSDTRGTTMIATVWFVVLVTIIATFVIYSVFWNVITVQLYQLAVVYSGNQSTADLVVLMWNYFPLPFLFSVIVWGFVSSIKKEPDVW
jgi:hypothetical protein